MSEKTLFSTADAERIEQQARDLVGKWPKISVLPNQISVTADYASPFARKASDRLMLIAMAGLVLLAGYLAWKTTVLDPYATLAYPHVAGYARSATEAMILAYLVPAGGLVILGTIVVLVLNWAHFMLGRTLHIAFMPEAISVQRRFRGFDRYPRATRMNFEMRPHERAKDEESWEQRELRQSKTSWTGRYYRKAFHIALRLGDYRRIDLADVYGERQAEALHNALNFAVDAIQRLPKQTRGVSPPGSHATGRDCLQSSGSYLKPIHLSFKPRCVERDECSLCYLPNTNWITAGRTQTSPVGHSVTWLVAIVLPISCVSVSTETYEQSDMPVAHIQMRGIGEFGT